MTTVSAAPRGGGTRGRIAIARGELQLDRVVAAVLCIVVGARVPLAAGVTAALLLPLVLTPVLSRSLLEQRLARWLVGLGIAAAASGLLLTAVASLDHETRTSLARDNTLSLLGLITASIALIWAVRILGVTAACWYGLGLAVGISFASFDVSNIWKFTLSVPVTVLLLALAARSRVWWLELACLVGLAVTSVANDSRSAAAMLMVAAVLLLRQRMQTWMQVRSGTVRTLLTFGLLILAGLFLIEALLVQGFFGSAIAQRTQEQIALSGSLISGGRPELGASLALISEHPLGLGAGAFATSSEVSAAKEGMRVFSYDPANGYVERYMFGGGYEVHSILGDLWLRFGVAGAALSLLVAGAVVLGTVRLLAQLRASGLLLYLVVQVVWDTLFSPYFPTSIATAAIAIALVTAAGDRSWAAETVKPEQRTPDGGVVRAISERPSPPGSPPGSRR